MTNSPTISAWSAIYRLDVTQGPGSGVMILNDLRAFDAGKPGSATGVAALLGGLCSALLEKSLKGGLIVVGGLNLGGSLDPVRNVVSVVEAAASQGDCASIRRRSG